MDTFVGLTPDAPVRVAVLEDEAARTVRPLVRPTVHRREVGMRALVEALEHAGDEARRDVEQALERGQSVEPSPLHLTVLG